MVNRLPINHYLHLREQGVDHGTAVAHTTQRYGIPSVELLEGLAESRRHHLAILSMIPNTVESNGATPNP